MSDDRKELKDDPALRSLFEVNPREALRIDTLYVKESLVDAIIENAKEEEGGFNEDYLKKAFLAFIMTAPKPIPEEVEKVFSRPQGKGWRVEVKSRIGHWIVTKFLSMHRHVEVTHSEGKMILKCLNCFKSAELPARRMPDVPSYYQINLEDCNAGD